MKKILDICGHLSIQRFYFNSTLPRLKTASLYSSLIQTIEWTDSKIKNNLVTT